MSGVFADGQGHLLNEGQATTPESLDVSALSELNFVQGQTYTLEETRAPAGYELISGKLTFSVDKDGKGTLDLSGVSNGSYAVSADGVAITAVDEPIEAQVTKVSSADGTALAGATFTLSPADGKNADGQPNHFADASAAGVPRSRDGRGWRRAHSGRNARGRQRVRAGGDRGPGWLRPR